MEQLDTIFLIDSEAKLSGTVAVARLLLGPDEQVVAELKSVPLLSVPPEEDVKEVFELFDKYNLRSLGVVDNGGRPIGAITVDDVVTRLRAH